jgi:hypothetical protein
VIGELGLKDLGLRARSLMGMRGTLARQFPRLPVRSLRGANRLSFLPIDNNAGVHSGSLGLSLLRWTMKA